MKFKKNESLTLSFDASRDFGLQEGRCEHCNREFDTTVPKPDIVPYGGYLYHELCADVVEAKRWLDEALAERCTELWENLGRKPSAKRRQTLVEEFVETLNWYSKRRWEIPEHQERLEELQKLANMQPLNSFVN